VETDDPCEVRVRTTPSGGPPKPLAAPHSEHTFEVAGHHYALVVVDGLGEGSVHEYEVELDQQIAWPAPNSTDPPSRIRTLDHARPQRIAFGSCRVASQHSVTRARRYGVDALDAYAVRTAQQPDDGWPDLLLMLGDQVYADDTTGRTRERIAARRDISVPPGAEVADFEEYTWLYHESWSDPEIRWLMSTVPVAMIFDDHDVRDDWNTSRVWRDAIRATGWWEDRIAGGLVSYWIYQHLGNLSPAELADDDVYGRVRTAAAAGEDAGPLLRDFALAADREAEGARGYRWSFWRDLGTTRLVVLDSRCGRILDGKRSMLSDDEFAWIEERLDGDYDHLLIGTSLPWVLSPALHALEAWNEKICEDDARPRLAAFGEKVRQGIDLEHWAAFGHSFDRLARMIADVATGRHGAGAPATVCVLSGDVHHSYVCDVDVSPLADPAQIVSRIYQVTCSPVHNWVPGVMRAAFSIFWSPLLARVFEGMIRRGIVPRPPIAWRTTGGPFYGNTIATLVLEGRAGRVVLESSRRATQARPLETILARDLEG
jgi:hypothetical protein